MKRPTLTRQPLTAEQRAPCRNCSHQRWLHHHDMHCGGAGRCRCGRFVFETPRPTMPIIFGKAAR